MGKCLLQIMISVLALTTVITSSAHAAPAPYADWVFDLKRANEKNDLEALTKLVKAKPGFARIWFYGNVFDLVTEGVPKRTKDALKPRLGRIAEILGKQEATDMLPALFLDRLPTGRLAKEAARRRELQQQWFSMAQSGQLLPLRLASIEEPELAMATLYGLIYRANLARSRMSGQQQHAYFLRVARLLAEGFALGAGDLGPWRTLAAYIPKARSKDAMGTAVQVGLQAKGIVEQALVKSLNVQLLGNADASFESMVATLNGARAARGGSLFVALMVNGAANIAHGRKDFVGARAYRLQVLQGVRSLNLPKLNALVTRQLVGDHLADRSLDPMVSHTRSLRSFEPQMVNTAATLKVLLAAATALDEYARQRAENAELSSALQTLDEAAQLFAVLARPAAVAVTHMQEQSTAVIRDRMRRRAELFRLKGWILLRLGRADAAQGAFRQVVSIYEKELNEGVGASTGQTALAAAILTSGKSDNALKNTSAASERLGPQGDPVAHAGNYLVQGWIRFTRGEFAKAYGNATLGLRLLQESGTAQSHARLRARLHALASSVLDGAGLSADAAARMSFAVKLSPEDPEIVRMAALARMHTGDVDGALSALDPLVNTEHAQLGSVWQGCILIRAGRLEEGLTMLSTLIPQMTLPHLMHASMVGRTCLAHGHLKNGETQAARTAIQPAQRLIQRYPNPSIAWRLSALDGEINAREGRVLDAAGSLRQALNAYMVAVGERPWRGATIAYRSLGLPATPHESLKSLPILLARAGVQDKPNRASHMLAAVKIADWLERYTSAPENRSFDPDGVNDLERAVHGHLARLDEMRQNLGDRALIGRERSRIEQEYRALTEALREVVRDSINSDRPGYDYFAPQPNPVELSQKEAILRYLVLEDATHLWLVLDSTDVRYYILPGRQKIAAYVDAAQRIMMSVPTPWDLEKKRPKDPNRKHWKALSEPTRVLLPFVRDRKVMAALSGRIIRVMPDGPLVRFPLDALVLRAPGRRADGKAPIFVGTRLHLEYTLPNQARPVIETPKKIVVYGPLDADSNGCPVDETGLDLCSAERSAAAINSLGSYVNSATLLSGSSLTIESALAAFKSHTLAVFAVPLDFPAGAFIMPPLSKDEPHRRMGASEFANLGAGALQVLVTSGGGAAGSTENGVEFRRLQAGLSATGTKVLVVNVHSDADDAESLARIKPYLSASEDMHSAIFSMRKKAMTTDYDFGSGGDIVHHPYYWARWLAYSDVASIPVQVNPAGPEDSQSEEPAPAKEDDTAPPTPSEDDAAVEENEASSEEPAQKIETEKPETPSKGGDTKQADKRGKVKGKAEATTPPSTVSGVGSTSDKVMDMPEDTPTKE